MKTSHTTFGRALAALLALTLIRPAAAAPGDITQVPAPALGADPPKARDIGDGDVSVSTQTGGFSYSYPIAVPPGRLGMQPSLALSYSSQGANYGGIAAGWSLSIPEITIDTSYSFLRTIVGEGIGHHEGPHVSTLAGGRPLVEVEETALPDVVQTYRAKNDSTWARYERMHFTSGMSWRVRTTDGVTHYFGETSRAPMSTNTWAPLTRSVDSFGNTIEYIWSDWQISQINYTSNPAASLPAFARVDFVWEDGFFCYGMPVGSQRDRKLGLNVVRGQKQLAKIRALAGTTTITHTREITLGYSSSHAACGGKHAPMRVLESIQESAWGANAPRVDLPPVTFEYNRFERSFAANATEQNIATLWPGDSLPYNLGWGKRSKAGWPTVESMMLDYDGDGLQDRLYMAPDPASPNECAFRWYKNVGRQTDGSYRFADEPSAPQHLPRLPWRDTNRATTEWCSLSAQFSLKENLNVSGQSPCVENTGSYLAYRWLDMTGDKLPDLVTAIHHDPKYFDPDLIYNWPSCTPAPACPAVSAECMDEVVQCPNPDQSCYHDEGSVDACLDQAPNVPCHLLTRQAGAGSAGQCRGTCAGNEMCQQACSTPDRIEADPVDPSICATKKAHQRCDRYPWTIYENLGGQISGQGVVKYQPIPLESDAGDSSFGGGAITSAGEAIQDIDGDGNLDAIIRSGYTEQEVEIDHDNQAWLVFPGDGNGNFLTSATGRPHVWAVPDAAPIGASCSAVAGAPCSAYDYRYKVPMLEEDLHTQSMSTLADLDGDGAPDLIWKMSQYQFVGPPQVTWLDVEEDDPIVVYRSNGLAFEYTGSADAPVGVPLAYGGVTSFSRSEVAGSEHDTSHFMTKGTRISRSRLVDIDEDGRLDLLESGWTGSGWELPALFINNGGQMMPGILLNLHETERWHQESKATNEAGAQRWETRRDVVDLDGDGIPESWNFDGETETVTFHRDPDPDAQPMRLMSAVHNGRGATIEVKYAPSTDSTVVTQNAGLTQNGERHAMPSTQWVVKEMSVKDQWEPTELTTTKYQYTNPMWKPDDEDRWGFRGFENVTTTRPSGAKQVDTYGFDVDWSGRLKASRVYAAEDLANPRTISETTWQQKLLFGNALKTFHVNYEKQWTCSNGQSEAACKAASNNCVTTRYIYTALPATGTQQVYYANQIYKLGGNYEGYYPGDRRTLVTQALFSDADDYRMKQTFSGDLELLTSAPGQEKYSSYALSGYDAAFKAQNHSDVYFTLAPSYQRAVTTWEYDWAIGVPIWKRSPRSFPNGLVESYVYDSTKRFVTTTANEAMHMVHRTYHSGTGALLSEQGPSSSSCGAGCTNWEQTWTDIDGLGRPVAAYVNVPIAGSPVWQKTKVSRTAYTDTVIGGANTKVVAESLLEWDVDRWTREETRVDGQGRPVQVIVEAGPLSPDAVTSFDYDIRGQLVEVSLPDPSQNTTAVVTYTYSYDSLGRPTAMRRPSIGGPEASGVNLSYDGLVYDRQEVAGSQGGSTARSTLIHDRFGRLSEVREYTGATTYATTSYLYDAGDRVRRIQNPDGVVTELHHDMGGRRTRVVRAGKEWTYGYNAEGAMVSESAPPPSIGLAAAYTTTYGYDVLGRQSSSTVGVREMTTPDLQFFGIGTITFAHDSCANGTGRLCGVTFPNNVLSSSYAYDAVGNAVSESRTFNFAGVTGTRAAAAVFGPGGQVVEQTYADNPNGGTDATRARFAYDDRGLPRTVRWVRPGIPGDLLVASQVRNTAGLVTLRGTSMQVPGWNEYASEWTYDQLTRVTSHRIFDSTLTELAKQQLGYFGQDDPKQLQHWMGTAYYDFDLGYDARHQLQNVKEAANRFVANYAFTAAGKLSNVDIAVQNPGPGSDVIPRHVDYVYASPSDPEAVSALVPVGGGVPFRSYAYDTVGSLTSRSGSTTDSFQYDGENQLRRAVVTVAGVTSTEEYFYDHTGQRTAVVTRNNSGSVTAVRVFLGDAEVVLTPAGTIDKTYAHLSLGTPVARIADRTDIELQYQGLANNTLLSIDANGSIQSGFVYAPYGELLESTGQSVAEQHRRFNDKFRDDATRLSYYGHRYYDNVTLSWTQADPKYRFLPDYLSQEPRRASLYQFVDGNPVRYLDPDGLERDNPWVITGSGKYGGVNILDDARFDGPMDANGKRAALILVGGPALIFGVIIAAPAVVAAAPAVVTNGLVGTAVVGGVVLADQATGGYVADALTTVASLGVTTIGGMLGGGDGGAGGGGVGATQPHPPLPQNPDDLLTQGYVETTHPKAGEKGHRTFENKDTGDKVRFDAPKTTADGKPAPGHGGKAHYHRSNPAKTGKGDAYLDKNGNPVPDGHDKSHLYPGE